MLQKKITSLIYTTFNFKSIIKNYTFFTLYILSRPKLLILSLKGIYLPQYLQYEWVNKLQVNTFIDIGALDGNISKVVNYMFPKAALFAFEPIKHKKGVIESKIKSNNLVVETLALSDHSGSQIFFEYDYLAASSFLKPNFKDNFLTKNVVSKRYPVTITTLDEYFELRKLKKPIIIKMDTQGTEDLIIKGGQKTLKQVSIIIIESSFVKSYKNQCLFNNIYNELTKMGFTYMGGMLDSFFYPFFGPMVQENSIFITLNPTAKLLG